MTDKIMMDKIRKGCAILLAALFFLWIFSGISQEYQSSVYSSAVQYHKADGTKKDNRPPEPSLYSRAAVLMDGDSGRVLYGKNENEELSNASTTKVMTCIIALENASLEQEVTFSENAASMPKVALNAGKGETFYLKDLLYSMMLESHNDSAMAVAEAVAGNRETFARLMNEKARDIGCYHTHFVTPNGLDAADDKGIKHYTTAKDMAYILRYAMKISPMAEKFMEITRTTSYDFTDVEGKHSYHVNNHNALLQKYQGALTGKTGFTCMAGYCYVGAVESEGRVFIMALLNCGGYPHRSLKWKDTDILLSYGKDNYHYRTFAPKPGKNLMLPVENGKKEDVSLKAYMPEVKYLCGEWEKYTWKMILIHHLDAPVEEKQVVGNIIYSLNGKTIGSYSIFTQEKVEKSTFFWRILQLFQKRLK